MSLTVLIADDHDIIRQGIKSLLVQKSDYKVIGEAVDGEDVLEKVKSLKPDILLLDISMPKVSGLDIIQQIRRVCDRTKVIIITMHKMSIYLLKAFKAGVKGYLNKENVVEELLLALRRVGAGETYISTAISSQLVDEIATKGLERVTKKELLTVREQDVLRLLCEGKTAKEIARVLFISPRTVENYKNNILKKLNLHRTSDLIKYALEHKLVE